VTRRLFDLAQSAWATFDGWCASRDIDPLELPPDRFCNLTYYWATRNASSEADLGKFDRRLWLPDKEETQAKGVPKESPWSAENETSAFKALKAALQPDSPKASAAPTAAGSLTNSGTPGSRGPTAAGRR
jgi:hypothetical protein